MIGVVRVVGVGKIITVVGIIRIVGVSVVWVVSVVRVIMYVCKHDDDAYVTHSCIRKYEYLHVHVNVYM